MTLLTIFPTVSLVHPLLYILVKLNLLNSFILLQKFGYFYIFILAQVLSLHLEQDALLIGVHLLINIVVFKLVNNIGQVVLWTQITASGQTIGAFAGILNNSLSLFRG